MKDNFAVNYGKITVTLSYNCAFIYKKFGMKLQKQWSFLKVEESITNIQSPVHETNLCLNPFL